MSEYIDERGAFYLLERLKQILYRKPEGGIPRGDLSDPVKESLDLADSSVQEVVETDPTVPAWAKTENKPTYTAEEVGAVSVNAPLPEMLSDLGEDSTHMTVTDTEKATWNAKAGVAEIDEYIDARMGPIQIRADADHTRAEEDHTFAVSDHGVAADDHTTAGGDHNTAVADHGIAEADHTTAGNDHTQAEADHTLAGTDHTTAAADHQTAAADHTRAESDHTRAEADHASIADKADVDGYYEQMTVGLAENLVGVNVVPAEYVFRKTPSGTATGLAQIEQIKGNTLVWNQVANNSHFPEATRKGVLWGHDTDGVITANGTATGYESIAGWLSLGAGALEPTHKLLISRRIISGTISGTFGFDYNSDRSSRGENNEKFIIASSTASSKSYVWYDSGTVFTNVKIVFNIIDLTLLYGSGNEPTTVAEFEADYPLPYYAYNAGTLISNSASGIKTVGFNQWDEEWEEGVISNQTGQNTSGTNRIRSKNYIPVIPGLEYYCYFGADSGSNHLYVFYYDAGKNYLPNARSSSNISNGGRISGRRFIVPDGVYYIRFNSYGSTLSTYNHDICINISDASKNGTYEPYEEHTLSLNLTTLTGKLNGEGSSVVINPDGMAGQGSWADLGIVENGYLTKIIKKTPRVAVDLGDLSWSYFSSTTRFQSVLSTLKIAATNQTLVGIVCPLYKTVKPAELASENMAITSNNGVENGVLMIKNSNYTDGPTFKTAMSGVKLIYELATPQTYVLDTPIPVAYLVNGNGTEAVIPQGVDADGVPKTTSISYDVRYALDAKGALTALPKNYISKESMDNILTAFKTAGIISAYTLTYNSTTGKYDCTITAP